MTTFEVLIAEQSLSNSELRNFPWSHVDVSGSHSKEQFLPREEVHRRIFSSQTGLEFF